MQRAFMTKSAYEWEKVFGDAKIPLQAHRTHREFLNSPHALQSKLIVEVETEKYGTMRQVGKQYWLEDAAKGTQDPCPTPPPPAKHPGTPFLQGIKILDMSNVIAGPTIGAYLARFGAEVIKLDHVEPTYDALVAVLMGIPANRGKKSLLLDVKKGDARAVTIKL